MNWRQQRAMQELQRADRVLAAQGFEDSAKLALRLSPRGTGKGNAIDAAALFVSMTIASIGGWKVGLAVMGGLLLGSAVKDRIQASRRPRPTLLLVLGHRGKYIDDGTGPLVRLSDNSWIDFGSLWYTNGFKVTVTDGDRRWIGEADFRRREIDVVRSVWSNTMPSTW